MVDSCGRGREKRTGSEGERGRGGRMKGLGGEEAEWDCEGEAIVSEFDAVTRFPRCGELESMSGVHIRRRSARTSFTA